MKISYFTSDNAFGTNCYIVISEQNNAVLIDAPQADNDALEQLEKQGVKIKKILLTHGHCDHIESLAFLAEKYGAEVYIHKLDEPKLHDDFLNLSEYFGSLYSSPIQHFKGAKTVEDGDIITLDELEFKVIHTPGHTRGSVCYIVNDVMFSGDTLFKQSIGRTDMPDGDTNTLMSSLKRLEKIEGDYLLLTGHGGSSRLSEERANNPYMKGFDYDNMF